MSLKPWAPPPFCIQGADVSATCPSGLNGHSGTFSPLGSLPWAWNHWELVSAEAGGPGQSPRGQMAKREAPRPAGQSLLTGQSGTGLLGTPCPGQSLEVPGRPPQSKRRKRASRAAGPARFGQFSRFRGFGLSRWICPRVNWNQPLSLGPSSQWGPPREARHRTGS